ncbi:MAG TPA: SRPBCC domain-containing protein [Chitinophagaceae bacterium]|nr:SRPBCC domain-containing protein [Chitinophagaceae bacterium]
MAHDLKIELLLPATPKQLMQLLTDQQQIAIWSGEAAVFEAKEGGKVSLFDGWMIGEVQSITDKELSYTCTCSDWPEGTNVSLV